ncbi:MAG TPA: helix-turn-helix transcriptional regulator [Ilumatobacter sp.]|nr:helix-turn-helix transcriptional regulator [Ilumatobacter sp.]
MAVREGLLALLDDGPRHGYQLKTEFEAVTGGTWPLNVGQVYTTLDRLARDGYVLVDEHDGQKSYALTAAGREELGAWWQATSAEDPPPRDELMLKVLLAVESGREHALAVITRQRTALFQLLQRRRRERPAVSLADQLVTEALIVRAEADLRWLDLCEQKLLAAPTAPERTPR